MAHARIRFLSAGLAGWVMFGVTPVAAQALPPRPSASTPQSAGSGLPVRNSGAPTMTTVAPAAGTAAPADPAPPSSTSGTRGAPGGPASLEQAERARAAGDHTTAISIAQRVAQRDGMTPALRLFLAEEYRANVDAAHAVRNAQACIRETSQNTAARGLESTLARCRAIETELRARTASLVLNVRGEQPDRLHIRVNDERFDLNDLGQPYVASSGVNFVVARARGHRTVTQPLYLTAGQSTNFDIEMLPLHAGEPEDYDPDDEANVVHDDAPTAGTAEVTTGAEAVREALGTDRNRGPAVGAGPYVLIGLGGALVATSIGLYVARGNAIQGCWVGDSVYCPDLASRDRAAPAPGYALGGLVTMIAGGAALAGGAAWAVVSFVQSRRGASAPRAQWTVTPTADGAAIVVGGAL